MLSPGPREPYRLVAALRPLPAADEEVLDPDADGTAGVGLWPQPGAAAAAPSGGGTSRAAALGDVVAQLPERYLSVLTEGDASPFAPEFAPDPVSARVRGRAAALGQAVAAAGRVTATHGTAGGAGTPGGTLLAVQDAAGDGVVVTVVDTTLTVAPRRSATSVPVPDEAGDMAALREMVAAPAVPGLTVDSSAVLMFAVPARSGNIRLTAAAEGVTGAKAS